jgi:excisionase family DNA binding protein
MTNTELLTTAQVAALKGVSVRTVARWVETGKLTAAVKIPGKTGAYLFTPDAVEDQAA